MEIKEHNKLEFEVKDVKNMIFELYEHLRNNPGFTGSIELYGNLNYKTIDRYYAIGYCQNGMFHRENNFSVLINFKDYQYLEYHLNGVFLHSKFFNYFDEICE
jgi:hypothetical protein